jgi:hypothetical protein
MLTTILFLSTMAFASGEPPKPPCEVASPDANECSETRLDVLEDEVEALKSKKMTDAQLARYRIVTEMIKVFKCREYGIDCPVVPAAEPTTTRPPITPTTPQATKPAETPKKTLLEQLKGVVTGTSKPDEGGTRPGPGVPPVIDPTPSTPSAAATATADGGQATATATGTTPNAPVEPAPANNAVEGNHWQLGAYTGIAGARHVVIPGLTPPTTIYGVVGAKIHLDTGSIGYLSLQGGAMAGTFGTVGFEGSFGFGLQATDNVEVGGLMGLHEDEVKGEAGILAPIALALRSGITTGISVAWTPFEEKRHVFTGYLATDLLGGVTNTSNDSVRDLGTTVGITYTGYGKARKSKPEAVAKKAEPEVKLKAEPESETYAVILTSDTPITASKPRGQEVPVH